MATAAAVSQAAFDNAGSSSSASASASASAPASAQPPTQSVHRRVYQACIPCRRRKVRCDLGSVDNPHDPPCVRCRRESKDCYFSATRRKRKPTDDGEGEYEGGVDEYEIRNGRKRLRGSSDDTSPARAGGQPSVSSYPLAPPPTYTAPLSANLPQQPLTPGGSISRSQPLRRPATDTQSPITPQQSQKNSLSHSHSYPSATSVKRSTSAEEGEEDHLTNPTAEALLHTEMYNGHDALNLLFEAAGQSGDIGHRRVGSQSSTSPPQAAVGTSGSYSASPVGGSDPRPTGTTPGTSSRAMLPPRPAAPRDPPIDPALTNSDGTLTQAQGSEDTVDRNDGLQNALRAWSNFRFVKAGWFTAREAVSYIE
ncbi:hypothetical protein GP486_004912 [Trichoglossum hirsutum]|uniref:Zn(2)-C6 fungal-type domain-containing protein n=1 Tax=Trichoglossum hirsutum TaxID=265104 RepID=A0A9P8LA63_9PEZI|nr:hypothetical protein GP486_004912 [Trichoglossum hirsutum]